MIILSIINKKAVNLIVLAIYAAVFALAGYYYSKGAFEGVEANDLVDAGFTQEEADGIIAKVSGN